MDLFKIIEPANNTVPIIISSPHSGTYFPNEVASQLKPEHVAQPDDTDWFIDRLYDFAPTLGIRMIIANYNRWVIDLNRDPDSAPLYSDGRVITGLVPTTNFNGESLYKDKLPDKQEVQRRLNAYYLPYHRQVEKLIEETKAEFGKALLFDAHSIRKVVPGIRKEAFPDLILGDNDGKSASPQVIDAAYGALKMPGKELQHNHPFKGGYITRSFGKPSENVHALQLEMAKTNYMNNTETQYNETRAGEMRTTLEKVFHSLIKALS